MQAVNHSNACDIGCSTFYLKGEKRMRLVDKNKVQESEDLMPALSKILSLVRSETKDKKG